MKKFACLIAMLLLLGVSAASAQKSVYIAGNPEMEPFEYYDKETSEYKGVLPEIYEQLQKETGIEFHYHMAKAGNQQKHLAQERQVELISVHWMGTIGGIEEELPLCTFMKDGKEKTLSIGFTPNMPKETGDLIRTAFSNLSGDEKLYRIVSEYERINWGIPHKAAAFLIGVLAAVIFFLLIVWKKDRESLAEKERLLKIDPLTSLGNRMMYEENFKKTITAEALGLYYAAYIAADLRRYQGNGDSVQCRTAKVLKEETQEYEFAARLGEDSFVFVFQALNSDSAVERMEDLIRRLNREGGLPNQMRYRTGVYVIADCETTSNDVLRYARRGWLYAEKHDRDCCLVDREALERVEKVERMERTLQEALDHKEFKLYMKFIEAAADKTICGAQAHSRWENPREGIIKRADYIQVMIETHMIDRMDFYLIDRVCEQLERWNGTENENLFISCEIREQTILCKDFIRRLSKITSLYHFDHRNLVLELSEETLASKDENLKINIYACHEAGFRIALGCFGSNQTSLMDFYDYLLDIVKVDSQMVRKARMAKGEILLRNLTRMAHDLRMQVLCEGVNTEEQREKVAKIGCDYIQNAQNFKVLPQDVAMEYLEKRRQKE